ncbi:hybrid sensor histidine kinase/response regulator [Magnetococcus sp. PR-3]|uniref:hybrid sensor histidine kinase/response regulator n=1 Tax=Magnetococcus sp. PR-3 TaxID=3120355 RepID=UPI002FCE17A2
MELDADFLNELLATFRAELEDQTAIMGDGLLALEKGLDADLRRETIHLIFRAAHNVKGAARGVEIKPLSDLSHRLESLFSTLQKNDAIPDQALITLALDAVDQMRQLGGQLGPGEPAPQDIAPLLDQLQAAAEHDFTATTTPLAEEPSTVEPSSPEPPSAPPSVETKSEHAQEAAKVEELQPEPPLEAQAEEPKETVEQAKPATDTTAKVIPPSEVIRVAASKINEAIGLAEEIQISKVQMEGLQAGVRGLEGTALNLIHQISCLSSFDDDGETLPDKELWQNFVQNAPSLISELKTQMRSMRFGVNERAKRMGLLSNNLQANLRMMRLVPLSTMTRPMARTSRDLCLELEKSADFKVIGDDIELDRAVLDQLKDPLTHLLRNAVDHAIEKPQERLSAGKPEQGTIELEVLAEGGTIQLVLKDDGRGLDLDRIKAKAIRERLITAEDAHNMDAEAVTELIFMPGFSSRDQVTSVSGRGVGLDVVRANLRHINGQVKVKTQLGEGTQFILTVPLTLSTERGLLVQLAGEVFALPISHVERIRSVPRDAVRTLEAGPAVVLDGRPMPLYSLSNLLGISGSNALSLNPMPVVILSKGWHQVAVAVDAVVGEQEIVVKPFQAPLCSVRHLKGGNLDRNGHIVVVLDSASLVDAALENRTGPLQLSDPTHYVEESEAKPPHILVVDDSITTRTLEKNILEAKGFQVTTAVNGQKGWDTLQEGSYDLVISDVEMPIMNGFEFARTIREDSRYDDLPVIIVSSLDSQENKRRGMEAGADAYIVKGSFETATLLQTVRELLDHDLS